MYSSIANGCTITSKKSLPIPVNYSENSPGKPAPTPQKNILSPGVKKYVKPSTTDKYPPLVLSENVKVNVKSKNVIYG